MTPSRRCDSDSETRWHVWRSHKGETFRSIGTFQGHTAEDAIERAVQMEIRRLPVGQCSGMYFSCPEDMLTRRDWAVSYEKRNVSNLSVEGQGNW